MTTQRIFTSSIAALFLAGSSASAGATERNEVATDRAGREPVAAASRDETAGTERKIECTQFCALREMPVYIPPNRGTAARRIGGGTRGGGFRS